jgi:hypothetical protein
MQELAWLAEPLRLWMEGASWAEIGATPGFRMFIVAAAVLVPSSFIMLGLGLWDWRETPLAHWFGIEPEDPQEASLWTWRARDIDHDGAADI